MGTAAINVSGMLSKVSPTNPEPTKASSKPERIVTGAAPSPANGTISHNSAGRAPFHRTANDTYPTGCHSRETCQFCPDHPTGLGSGDLQTMQQPSPIQYAGEVIEMSRGDCREVTIRGMKGAAIRMSAVAAAVPLGHESRVRRRQREQL